MDPKNNVADAGSKQQTASGKAPEQKTAPAAAPASDAKIAPATEKTLEAVLEESKPLIDFDEVIGILATSKSRSSGGAKIRPGIGYTLVAANMKSMANTNVPEQEQVVVKILLKALTTQKPVISEPELNKLVVAAHAAGALKTKQDPWHIFRYYRTDLKKRGVLKEVQLAA